MQEIDGKGASAKGATRDCKRLLDGDVLEGILLLMCRECVKVSAKTVLDCKSIEYVVDELGQLSGIRLVHLESQEMIL